MDFDALEKKYGSLYTAPAKTNKKGGRGGFLTSLISEGGGTGGAAAGAAIGSAVGPLGTIAGAGIGGLVGALTGRLAENKIRDDEFRAGDAVKEGLLTGALSAALPGLGAAKNALKGGATQAVEKAATRTALERSSEGLLGNAWGIRSGVKIAGKPVTPQRAAELQKFVVEGVKVPKAANADRVFEHLANFQDETGKAISTVLTGSTKPVDAKALGTSLETSFNKVLGGGAADNPVAQDILLRARQAKTPGELWELRKGIDDTLINFGRNPQTATPGGEQFARAARTEINRAIKAAVPEYSPLARSYGNASDAIELVSTAARTPKGAKAPGILGSIAGPQVQSVRALTGRTLGAAANGKATLAGALSSAPVKTFGSPVAANATSALIRNSQSPGENIDQTNTMPMNQSSAVMDPLSAEGEFESIPQAPSNPFDPENVDASIERIVAGGGKMKDVAEYISLVEALTKLKAPTGGAKPLGGEARNRALKAQSGLVSIDTLEDTLNRDPGAFQRQALPNPLGITARATGTTDVRAATDNLVDVIARLRSGAAITDSEAKRFARLLPQPGDDTRSASRKLTTLRAELESYLDPGSSEPTMEELMAQYAGAY